MEMFRMVGMYDIKSEMEKLVGNANAYRKGGAKIPHFIINLDAGNGQTFVTEEITDVLVNHKLREFHGLDEYLEYKPDGSLGNLKWMFADIADNAVYDNKYKGVISIDITNFAGNQNGYEMKYFEENLEKIAETATIILYCSTNMGIKGEKLKDRLGKVIGNVKKMEAYEYTSEDFANMVIQNITERGVEILDEKKVAKVLGEVITVKEVKTAKAAVALAEKILFYVDYSKMIPTLSFGKANDFKTNYCMGA